MVPFLAHLVFVSTQSYKIALGHAEGEYRKAIPYPLETPFEGDHIQKAFDLFLGIEHRFGRRASVQTWIAKCLLRLGRYRDAETAFEKAGDVDNAADARRRASIATLLSPNSGRLKVIQIEPVPGRENWVALMGQPIEPEPGPVLYYRTEVWLTCWSKAGCQVLSRTELPNHYNSDEPEPHKARMYWFQQTAKGNGPALLIYRNYMAANCWPAELRFYSLRSNALAKGPAFDSIFETSAYPDRRGRGILIAVTPRYKVRWTDLYLWNGKTTTFCNFAYPDLYPREQPFMSPRDAARDYVASMWDGALFDIHHRYQAAMTAWRRAGRDIQEPIRDPDDASQHEFMTGLYGSNANVLREIRQRIRWLRRHDYNHWLLYRPYDDDLQIPPYKLGNAQSRIRNNPRRTR